MFGIGGPELIIIAVVVLLFAGPKHLPEIMRKIGRITAELRVASAELRNQIEQETRDLETPTEIGKKLRRELAEDLVDPYAQVLAADRALRKKSTELLSDNPADNASVSNTEAANPDPDSTGGTGESS